MITLIPLASESMGSRSMCTYIETSDVKVLIDPGVSMGRRWGLLPHPQEYRELSRSREKIAHFATMSEIITISHYHFDHCTPTFTDYVWTFSNFNVAKQIFQGKIILAKDFRDKINPSQRRRGWMLKKMMRKYIKEFRIADGKTFTFGKTKFQFSTPVSHGVENSPLGWVLMLSVQFGEEKVMHVSDVQGPMLDSTLEIILDTKPRLIYVGGPPLYLVDYRVDRKYIDKGVDNIIRLVEEIPQVIIDHHLLRTGEWINSLEKAFITAKKKGHIIATAAEFMGKENKFLEYRRKDLYENEPPTKEFIKWTKLPKKKRREVKPPL